MAQHQGLVDQRQVVGRCAGLRVALVQHGLLQRRGLRHVQRRQPGAPLQRLVGEAVEADHWGGCGPRGLGGGVRRRICSSRARGRRLRVRKRRVHRHQAGHHARLVRQKSHQLGQGDDGRVRQASGAQPVQRSPVAATRVGGEQAGPVLHRRQGGRGGLLGGLLRQQRAVMRCQLRGLSSFAAVHRHAQAVSSRQTVHGFVQQGVVAGLRGLHHGGAEAPSGVQSAARRQAGGGVNHVQLPSGAGTLKGRSHRKLSSAGCEGKGEATHSSPSSSGSA